MTAVRRVIFGASGHGKVVADAWRSMGVDVEGFLDDDPSKHGLTLLGLPVFGGHEWLREQLHEATVLVALGIGENRARQFVAERCRAIGATLATIVHARAIVACDVAIGEAALICAGVVVNPDARIGDGAILNTSCVVEHDCVVGSFAHVSPNASMGGAAVVGDRGQLGLGATLLPRVTLGADALAGAGAVVVRDVEPYSVVAGVPACRLRGRTDR